MIRAFLIFFLLCSTSFAGTISLTKAANVSGVAGSYVTAGSSAFNAMSFNSAFTTQVAGRAVTMPASYRLAANAAQIGVGAVRLNPAGLATAAVVAWLLPYGIKYINGMFVSDPDGAVEAIPELGAADCESVAAAGGVCGNAAWRAANGYAVTCRPNAAQPAIKTDVGCYYQGNGVSEAQWSTVNMVKTWNCPTGYYYQSGLCVASAVPVPESKWSSVNSLPDAVASQLSSSVPLPLENPVFSPTTAEIPLNEPTLDPETGKYTREIAVITPSSSNPEEAKLDVVEEETDAEGNAVTNSSGQKVQTNTDDPCLENPGRIGCSEWGKPDDSDLETNTKNIAITPQSGFGPDSASCPADLTYTIRQGTTVRFSYSPVCKAADIFRPVVIGLAWISAVLLFVGISRRAQS